MDEIKNMMIEELLQSKVGEKIKNIMVEYEQCQRALYNLVTSEDENVLTCLKIGTVLTLAVIDKMAAGKAPAQFTEDDWKELALKVRDDAILLEPEEYSKMVFLTYADYIDASAYKVSTYVSEEKVATIKALAEDIREKSALLEEKQISETSYIEDCMWILLDAMVKSMSCYSTKYVGAEFGNLIQGIGDLSFEYGRYVLLQKEQALIAQYLENQYQLDEELQIKYDEYISELNKKVKEFDALMKDAFSSDVRARLSGSVNLAKSVGVEEVLETIEDIDDFFL